MFIDIPVAGQNGTIPIDTQPGCAWTAAVASDHSGFWTTIDTTSSVGPGSVNYSAATFPARWDGSPMRQLRVQVRWNTPTRGQDVVVTQRAGACSAGFTPANRPVSSVTFGALAGAGSFDVLADLPFSGAWYMETASDWLALSPPSRIFRYGDGAATFFVAPNPSPQPRSGTIVGCDGQAFTIRQAGRTAATGHYVPGDFDGDGRADLVIVRPHYDGTFTRTPDDFYVLQSGSDYSYAGARRIATMGNGTGMRPVIGDFDGDGRADVATLESGNWRVVYSTDDYGPATETHYPFPADFYLSVPLTADFGATGKSALTLFDAGSGTWDSTPLPGSPRSLPHTQWGQYGDLPIAADFDGDGVADVAVWRPGDGRWYILYSRSNYAASSARSFQWGRSGDLPVTADIDGDGLADLAVWRPSTGTWHILPSGRGFDSQSAVAYQWGAEGDIPIAADYDGDGRTDFGIWRPSTGTWYLLFSSSGYAYSAARAIQWGTASRFPSVFDRPVSPTSAVSPDSITRRTATGTPTARAIRRTVSCSSSRRKSLERTNLQAFVD